jgi:natural product precursor
MKTLKLNSLANDSLGMREMNKIIGGLAECCCACAGSSGTSDNNNANDKRGLQSPQCINNKEL